MHPRPLRRREIIQSRLDVSKLKIVEIGALASPTFLAKECSVKFIDYTTTENLRREHANNAYIVADNIVNIDYAVPDLQYSRYIEDRFDLAIANHVVEHIPDTISWLNELYAILNESGHVFLSVPDRRYTFDYLKRETNIVDVVRAYHEKRIKPDFYQLFEHNYYSRPLQADDCWSGRAERIASSTGMSIHDAIRHAKRASELPYVSTHCHTYTMTSFLSLFSDLRKLGLVSFEISQIHDVDRGANEFHVLLRKCPASQTPSSI